MPRPQQPRPPHPGQTRAEADRSAAYHHLAQTLRGLEEDLRWGLTDSPRIPAAWTGIAQGPVFPEKQLTTIRVDKDEVAFFRAMGPGHLPRMNAVLRTFMLSRLAGVVKGPEAVEYRRTDEEEAEAEEERRFAGLTEGEAEARREADRKHAEKWQRHIDNMSSAFTALGEK